MAKPHLLVCGKVFDGVHDEFTGPLEILVEGKSIAAMGKNLHRPKDAVVVDLSDATVTPGLIDNHIHSDHWDWRKRRLEIYSTSDEYKVLSALHSAMHSLARGFTSVRHLNIGILGYGLADAKRAIAAGHFAGARMFVANHRLGCTGGHPDTSGYFRDNPRLSEMVVQPGIGTGPEFFRDAVRKEIKYGSDVIKFMSTAGMFGPGYSSPLCTPETEQLTCEETRAIIDTANAYGVPTTSHVFSPAQMKTLVECGITCIEHGAFMDAETAELLEKAGVPLVPTFQQHDEGIYYTEESLGEKNAFARGRIERYGAMLKSGREAILNSKIRLGFGTDIVAETPAYESWREYEAWLRADPGGAFRILKAATSVNASILKRPDLGELAVGGTADIAAWKRDLLTDPKALSECAFVMKEGVRHAPHVPGAAQ